MSVDIIIIYPSHTKLYYIVYIFVYLYILHIAMIYSHCYDLFTDDKSTVTKKQEVSLPGTDLCSISVSLS